MSHRARSPHHPGDAQADAYRPHGPHAGGHPHAASPHAGPRTAAARRPAAADWTLGHAGRQVRIGPVVFWTIVGTLVIMAGWSVATATYFAFQDELLTRLIGRQADMQYAYEDRIAELRGQVDRLASRQLLDQEQYERKLELILRRQAQLESRAATLAGVPDPTPTGSIRPTRAPAVERSQGDVRPKPSPINDTVILVPPPEREARLESRTAPGATTSFAAAGFAAKTAGAGLEAVLARLQTSLDRVEHRQIASLTALEETYDAKAKRIRAVLTDLGIDAGKLPPKSATGGPFVPVGAAAGVNVFDRQIQRVGLAKAQVERLSRTLVAVPVRKPLPGDVETTSGFGVRMDPFLRSPAMHTGLDFRGDTGQPVRATAAGSITVAGANGGYGRMVEIDHGNGFTTRYAHLSAVDVDVGDKVRIGQVIGRVGSTGRSTGPHLHYETRVDGDPVDPRKFLRAGLRLGGDL